MENTSLVPRGHGLGMRLEKSTHTRACTLTVRVLADMVMVAETLAKPLDEVAWFPVYLCPNVYINHQHSSSEVCWC